jgi:hypothetical protein
MPCHSNKKMIYYAVADHRSNMTSSRCFDDLQCGIYSHYDKDVEVVEDAGEVVKD